MTKRDDSIDFEAVQDIARSLPDVVDSTSSRGVAFKIRGKLFACAAIHKSAEPDSLMVRIDFDHRDALLAAQPAIYYLTDHYRGYPAILVRLGKINRDALRDLLHSAVLFVTAKKRGS
jgi:hypothetical protein